MVSRVCLAVVRGGCSDVRHEGPVFIARLGFGQTSRLSFFGTQKPIDLKWGYRNKLEFNGLFGDSDSIATRRGNYPNAVNVLVMESYGGIDETQ